MLYTVAVVLVLLSAFSPSFSSATNLLSVECVDKKLYSGGLSIDTVRATALAISNSEFKSRTSGYEVAFHSIFYISNFDTATCSVTLETVNVVHSLFKNGQYVKNLIVTENPELTTVLSVWEFEGIFASSTQYYGNWAGYETYVGSYPSTTNIWQTKASWNVPSISIPDLGCNNVHCDLSIWTGLTDSLGASSGKLARGGTDSGIFCFGGCSWFYYSWYEFLPNSAQSCGNGSVAVGDSITTTVSLQGFVTGGALYYINVKDNTKGTACGTTNSVYSLTSPTVAEFISERPNIGFSPARLPQFTSDTMSSLNLYYSGAWQTAQERITAGTYQLAIMQNYCSQYGTVQNTITGGFASNSFYV